MWGWHFQRFRELAGDMLDNRARWTREQWEEFGGEAHLLMTMAMEVLPDRDYIAPNDLVDIKGARKLDDRALYLRVVRSVHLFREALEARTKLAAHEVDSRGFNLTPRRREILQTLAESKTRLTPPKLFRVMESVGSDISDHTLRIELAKMHNAKWLDNDQRKAPRGYRITDRGRGALKGK